MPMFRVTGQSIESTLRDGRTLALSPQELVECVDEAHYFLLEHHARFKPALVKKVVKNSKEYNVTLSSNLRFWNELEYGQWEPGTFKVFDRYVSASCVYIDIGAWIGPTAFYCAQVARLSYAFEPDPVAFKELEQNFQANRERDWISRLTVYNAAIASASGTIQLGSREGGGDSMSSVLFSDEHTSWEVKAIRLQDFIKHNGLEDRELFIKMDIEGGEYDLIPTLKEVFLQENCHLYLSLHPHFLMRSIGKNVRIPFLGGLVGRLVFVYRHIKIFQSLPYRYFYTSEGQPLRPLKELLKALLIGRVKTELVATNKKW